MGIEHEMEGGTIGDGLAGRDHHVIHRSD